MKKSVALILAAVPAMLSLATPLRAQIAQEAGYNLVYQLNMAGSVAYNSTGVPYSINNAGLFKTGSFTRVAYEWTLSGSTDPNSPNGTMWVSFNTPSTVANQLGVPANGTGEYYNQAVNNMNVITTLSGLSGTNLSSGTIQFWPTNYGTNTLTGNFDWNDCCGGAAGNGYGHMDINEVFPTSDTNVYGQTGQVLAAFSNWGGNGGPNNVGIGDRPGGGFQTDYTFANNVGSYTSAILTVFVNAEPVPEPSSIVALCGLGAIGLVLVVRRRRKQAR